MVLQKIRSNQLKNVLLNLKQPRKRLRKRLKKKKHKKKLKKNRNSRKLKPQHQQKKNHKVVIQVATLEIEMEDGIDQMESLPLKRKSEKRVCNGNLLRLKKS